MQLTPTLLLFFLFFLLIFLISCLTSPHFYFYKFSTKSLLLVCLSSVSWASPPNSITSFYLPTPTLNVSLTMCQSFPCSPSLRAPYFIHPYISQPISHSPFSFYFILLWSGKATRVQEHSFQIYISNIVSHSFISGMKKKSWEYKIVFKMSGFSDSNAKLSYW